LKAGRRFGPTTTTCVIDDERVVGCIRAEVVLGQPKWRVAINGVSHGLPPPHNGVANTLDEAKAAFKQRYEPAQRAAQPFPAEQGAAAIWLRAALTLFPDHQERDKPAGV